MDIGDDVVNNILERLPGKPLLRLRCVSKHWNGLISDPYFMKSRSRRMILFPFLQQPLVGIDPMDHSMVRIPSPLEADGLHELSIVGTLNGIVLLALTHKSFRCDMILYNPLTLASKLLVAMDRPSSIGNAFSYVFGFADSIIVRFEFIQPIVWYKWDVFDLKTSSWTAPQYMKRDFYFWGDTGVFLNGFLYWAIARQHPFRILALNVKEMVFSKFNILDGLDPTMVLLGSIDGCLCVINTAYCTPRIDVWLMKEQCDGNSWVKAHSFTFGLKVNRFYPICILGNGNILIMNSSIQLVIYDTSKDSYKMFNDLETLDHFKRMSWIFKFRSLYPTFLLKDIRSIEYVESLVSPSDMCFI